MKQSFTPTREAGLARLFAFVPRAGEAYARDRNFDFGPDRRHNISLLSPYLRHRVVTEREVCAAVLAAHSLQDAEKFIQEVLWRSYWKGWLQHRPGIWQRYLAELADQHALIERNVALCRDVLAATEGRTGIDGFDDWAQELVATGYLHNHARMWFASIWIFTLRLPWVSGADFFLRHLLDGDVASNTLSWRWVAGLHTRGKTYAASRDNIQQFTDGRFAPAGLAREAPALVDPEAGPALPLQPMADRFDDSCAVLLTEDDLGVETLPINWRKVTHVALANLTAHRTLTGVSDQVSTFGREFALDAIKRLSAVAPDAVVLSAPLVPIRPGEILPWLRAGAVTTLVIPETPVGPGADAVSPLVPALAREGIAVVRIRRSWDSTTWPHCTKGFFALKERIPAILRAEGVISESRE